MKTDTIAAIATGLSNAGISIIRISGENAITLTDSLFLAKNGKTLSESESHTIHYGHLEENGEMLDEVLVSVMKAPNSYTKEDVVEINCHGGIIVTKRILEAVIRAGARIAEPGEFTKRAFLNGRIDLTQAEAVIDIINAKNNMALSNSVRQLKGNVQEKIRLYREEILRDVAFIEAALDDPEHISIDGFSAELYRHVKNQIEHIQQLLHTADNGRMIKEGIRTVILGKPNAGKSSLLNLLLGEERAIVTDIEGTTRDTLEEYVQLNGITLQMIDTAGIRKTLDPVEKIGVERAKNSAKDADLILFVVDSSKELDENDYEILDFIKDKKSLVLINKTDLKQAISEDEIRSCTDSEIIPMSAKNRTGIEKLTQAISEMFFHGELKVNDEVYLTNLRHKEALMDTVTSLEKVIESIETGMSEDFFSIDLMDAYEKLGSILGESVDEDLVNMIFREFCMGK